jgi:hypothetical protein
MAIGFFTPRQRALRSMASEHEARSPALVAGIDYLTTVGASARVVVETVVDPVEQARIDEGRIVSAMERGRGFGGVEVAISMDVATQDIASLDAKHAMLKSVRDRAATSVAKAEALFKSEFDLTAERNGWMQGPLGQRTLRPMLALNDDVRLAHKKIAGRHGLVRVQNRAGDVMPSLRDKLKMANGLVATFDSSFERRFGRSYVHPAVAENQQQIESARRQAQLYAASGARARPTAYVKRLEETQVRRVVV